MPVRHYLLSLSFLLLFFAHLAIGSKSGDTPLPVHLNSSDEGVSQSFPTIQTALDAGKPGDTVQLAPGTYHENITFPRSGELGKPITIQGVGTETILDGANPSFQNPMKSTPRWIPFRDEALGFEGWRAELPIANISTPGVNTWASLTAVPGNHGCDRLLATYASLSGLKEARRGEGIFRDTKHVYLFLADGKDPNYIAISLGAARAVIDLATQSHIRIQSLEVRNAGDTGILISGESSSENCSDIKIENVTIRNCWQGVSSVGSGTASHLILNHIRVLNGIPDEWEWSGGYIDEIGTYTRAHFEGPWLGSGLNLKNLEDAEIRNSVILGQWDGMCIRKNRIRIHHNTIGHILDDGIELESPWSADIEFFNNHIFGAWTGISVTSNSPGPIYIYRNIVETTRFQTGMNPAAKNNGFGIKSGNDWAGRAENIKFYHNTFYSNSYNLWEKTNDKAPDRWRGYDFVNNIFFSYSPKANIVFRGAGSDNDGGDNHWESNLYNIDTPLSERSAITSPDLLMHFVKPGIGGPQSSTPNEPRNLRLLPETPGRNSASNYPERHGWPDSVLKETSQRDRGAWQEGMKDSDIGAPPDLMPLPLQVINTLSPAK